MRSKRECQIIIKLFNDGYSFSEISKLSNIPRSTTIGIIDRFKKQLKNKQPITQVELKQIVLNSTSVRQCLSALNLIESGGNYKLFYRKIEEFNIDTSHFSGKSQKHFHKPIKKDLKEILIEGSTYNTFKLKRRLLSENILKPICSNCNLDTWLQLPIPLELDHINGVSDDHRMENLRLLCPNCHAMTDTYRGKNIKKKRIKTNICIDCGGNTSQSKYLRCEKCNFLHRKK